LVKCPLKRAVPKKNPTTRINTTDVAEKYAAPTNKIAIVISTIFSKKLRFMSKTFLLLLIHPFFTQAVKDPLSSAAHKVCTEEKH